MSERVIFLKKVLVDYSTQLEKVCKNENLHELIKKDLMFNIGDSKRVSENLSHITIFSVIDGVDYKKIVCEALDWYIHKLEHGLELIKEEMRSNIILIKTKDEIDHAVRIHKEICKLREEEK